MEPAAGFALLRAVHFVPLVLLFGGGAYIHALTPSPLSEVLRTRLRSTFALAAAIAILSTFAWLPVQSAEIGEAWGAAGDAAGLAAGTSFGRVWMVRCALALALAGITLSRGAASAHATFVAGMLLASLALQGHAAAHWSLLGLMHRISHATHSLAGGFWLGALLPLAATVAALRSGRMTAEAVRAVGVFSSLAVVAVALVLMTGALNTWLVLGTWPDPGASDYQALLAAKIAGVLAMLALALLNRTVLAPRALGGNDAARRAFLMSIALEAVIGGCVLVAVAQLAILPPTQS